MGVESVGKCMKALVLHQTLISFHILEENGGFYDIGNGVENERPFMDMREVLLSVDLPRRRLHSSLRLMTLYYETCTCSRDEKNDSLIHVFMNN